MGPDDLPKVDLVPLVGNTHLSFSGDSNTVFSLNIHLKTYESNLEGR